jgi:hypothetical protein
VVTIQVALKLAGEDDRLDGVVHAEVETTVDDNTEDGRTETTVKTGNTVRGKGLLVDVDEAVELALTTLLGGLVVVGKTGTGVVQGVDEKEGSGTGGTTGRQVTGHPLGVTVALLLVTEHGLELVTEGKVQGLGGEVTDDVGSVTTPKSNGTLIGHGALEAVANAVVLAVKTTLLDHLILHVTNAPVRIRRNEKKKKKKKGWGVFFLTYLVLGKVLDTLNGGSRGLGDGGGDTTHHEINHEVLYMINQ